jgi:hypothetical protein
VPAKGKKIGRVIFDLEWRAAKSAARNGKISRMIVNFNLAVSDSDTARFAGTFPRTQILSPAPLGEISL